MGQPAGFDSHHPPSPDLIRECVHCGFCLQTCPTYAMWGEEMDSPRGRIYLMKLASEGKAAMTDTFVSHFDQCLGCMACMTACPSGVKYDRLIEATRSQIERNYRRPLADRLMRRLIFSVFPHPSRFRALLAPLRLYQRSGLQSLVRRSGLLRLLPPTLRSLESLLPEIPRASELPLRIPAQGPQRKRVGLVLGCVQRVLFPQVNAATARVLAAEGCEVVLPQGQPCCGALMVHAGLEQAAIDLARRTIDVFEGAGVDAVVANAAGCGSCLKDYVHLLRDDPQYAPRAAAFSAKCRDVSEVLSELPPRAPRNPIPLRAGYQDSCHLQHAQSVRSQPRAVLSSIPGLELVEIPEAALCCGSAGIYNLVKPGPARDLGDRKVRSILATNPDLVISANPGCLLQIRSGLMRAGARLPALHMIELLDASIRGVSPLSAAGG